MAKNSKPHRVDELSLAQTEGREEWYWNSDLHRLDGPAVVWADGQQEWWQNGKMHRENGPARVKTDGTLSWYIAGATMQSGQYKTVIRTLACDLTSEEKEKIETFSFFQIESLVYAFNGWKLST
jgi:hypothetical protein